MLDIIVRNAKLMLYLVIIPLVIVFIPSLILAYLFGVAGVLIGIIIGTFIVLCYVDWTFSESIFDDLV